MAGSISATFEQSIFSNCTCKKKLSSQIFVAGLDFNKFMAPKINVN
jgi:hypothetical protein